MKNILFYIVLGIVAFSTGFFLFQPLIFTGAPVLTTDTLETFRQRFNSLDGFVRASTSTLGAISSLSSSTGNLIVGSSSNWIALTVGSNNTCLQASSTAQGGLSWTPCGASSGITITTANRLQGGGDLTASRIISLASSTANGDLLIGSGTGGLWNIGSLTASGTIIQIVNGSGTISLGISVNPTFTNVTSTNFSATTIKDSQGNAYSTSTLPSINVCYGNETQNSVDTAYTGFYASSTILDVYAVNSKSGDGVSSASGSVTFNLGITTSTANSTSSLNKLFTSDQAVTATTSSVKLTVNGSSSAAAGRLISYYTTANSSSSEFCFVVHYSVP